MGEAKGVLSHPSVKEVMDRWEVKNATVHMALWTMPALLPKTNKIHRVDFERITAYLSRLMTEIGVRRETVEETWRRTLVEIERVRGPRTPPQVPQPAPEQRKEEQKP